MKLQRLHINHFGKLNNQTLTFGEGIHVISGDNESGKSTLHAFLRSMLFGIERSRGRGARTDSYTRYQPWSGGAYGGVLELEKDGHRYSIYRNFDKNQPAFRLADETIGRELTASSRNLSELLCGLNPSLFGNTISVGQLKASTNSELADELRNHIINLHTSGSASLNVTQAMEQLRLEKKQLESGFSLEADQESSELKLRIQAIEQDISSSGAEQVITRLESEKASLDRKILRLGDHHQQLTGTIKRNENSLTLKHFNHINEPEELYQETCDLEDSALTYLEQYHRPLKGFSRVGAFLWSLILAVLFLGCFGKAAMNLMAQFYLPAVGFFAGAVVAAVLFLRWSKRRSAAAAFRRVQRRLEEIWEDHFDDVPKEILAEEITDLKNRLDEYCILAETIVESQDQIQSDMSDIMALQQELKNTNEKLEEARHISWQSEQKEAALHTLEERLETLQDTISNNRRIEEEARAIQLAMDTLQELSTQIYDSFGYFLEETTSALLRGITDNAYTGVFIDSDLSILLEQDGRRIPLHQVSSGTMDQVYLALRLACIEFLWPDESMPLFLDDTFALYDKERLTSTLQWLAHNYPGQIFLFTCQDREEEIMNTMHIPHERIQL